MVLRVENIKRRVRAAQRSYVRSVRPGAAFVRAAHAAQRSKPRTRRSGVSDYVGLVPKLCSFRSSELCTVCLFMGFFSSSRGKLLAR